MVTQAQPATSPTPVDGLAAQTTPLPVQGADVVAPQVQIQPAQDGAAGPARDAQGRFLPKTPEQPVPETPAADAATPPAPVRIQDTPEFKALQAAKDREVAAIKAEYDKVRAERARMDQQAQIEAAVSQGEAETKAQLIAEGASEEYATREAKRLSAVFKEELRLKQESSRLQNWAKLQIATDIARQYGLPDPSILIGQPTEAMMVKVAEDYGKQLKQASRVAELEAELAKLKQAVVPNGQKYENGTQMPGGMSDDAWLAAYSRGESNDHARALRIRQAQGASPLR